MALAAMSVLLLKHGFKLQASNADSEKTLRGVADNSVSRENLVAWVRANIVTNP